MRVNVVLSGAADCAETRVAADVDGRRISPRLTSTPGIFRRAAPILAEHTREVLEEAGYSEDEIAALIDDGVAKLPQSAAWSAV